MHRCLMVAKATWPGERLPALLAGVGSVRDRISEHREVLGAKVHDHLLMGSESDLIVMRAVIAREDGRLKLH
jgi:hypothetical protein